MWRVATLALLALALSLPGAAAARSVAPPGNSEADQYFETLPASAGPQAPNPSKDEAVAVRDGNLSAGTARALQRHGATGRALGAAVAETAPARAARAGSASRAAPAPAVRLPVGAGLGAAFPLALVATAAAAIGFAVGRRRRAAVR
jgi:hypothetical protein